MNNPQVATLSTEPVRDICGIIMPIAEMSTIYTVEHWKDVRRIIDKAIEAAGYTPRMVSEAAEVNVIQASIVTNLAENSIVVCDVSGKNANCMFELGLRLAFDKPTIIIKDELTGYSFDTSPVKHLGYRSDLRFQNVMNFMDELTSTIRATAEAASEPSYSPFLNAFGKRPKNIPQSEGTALDYVLKRVDRLSAEMSEVANRISSAVPVQREHRFMNKSSSVNKLDINSALLTSMELNSIMSEINTLEATVSNMGIPRQIREQSKQKIEVLNDLLAQATADGNKT